MVKWIQRLDWKKWSVIVAVTLIASIPLFTGKIYYGHDTLFHITRVEGLKASLLAGQFPVRVSAVQFHEYGYISSALYPELLLYFPAALRLLGLSIPLTYCVFWFAVNFGTACISWWGGYGITKKRAGGYAGVVLFSLFPYRLISIYLRGAFGEALALSFFPLVLWGVYEIFYGDRRKWPVAVLGYSGILQCHILTITTVIILSVVWGICNIRCLWKDKKRILSIIALAGSVLFLNLWFLVPFLMLYKLPLWVKYSNSNFIEHVLQLWQLFPVILWGKGNSLPLNEGTAGEMPFSIGLGLIAGGLLILYSIARKKFVSKEMKRICLVSFGISLFFYWTTTVYFPWKVINRIFPFVSAFMSNLPWRRLGLAGTFLILAVCAAATQYSGRKQRWWVLALFGGSLLSSGSFMLSYIMVNEPYITSNADYRGGTEDELYLYHGTDVDALRQRGDQIVTSSAEVTVQDREKYYTNIKLIYANSSTEDGWIEVPLNFYPGYVARDEKGNEMPVLDGENHVLRVSVPKQSSGAITIGYEECTMYRCADIVTIVYLVLFVGWLCQNVKKKKNREIG